MSRETEQRIENAKLIVLRVLSGQLTPESDRAAFDEDSVYLSVRTAEIHDPEWLLQRIADSKSSVRGIHYVLECMGPLRDRAAVLISPPKDTSSTD